MKPKLPSLHIRIFFFAYACYFESPRATWQKSAESSSPAVNSTNTGTLIPDKIGKQEN